MEKFWAWTKVDSIKYDKYVIRGADQCEDFDEEFWFVLGKSTWKKNHSIFQDNFKNIRNNIVKPFRVEIFQDTKRVQDKHNIEKFLTTSSKKGYDYDKEYWNVRDKELSFRIGTES